MCWYTQEYIVYVPLADLATAKITEDGAQTKEVLSPGREVK
jgi:hypothetical protein